MSRLRSRLPDLLRQPVSSENRRLASGMGFHYAWSIQCERWNLTESTVRGLMQRTVTDGDNRGCEIERSDGSRRGRTRTRGHSALPAGDLARTEEARLAHGARGPRLVAPHRRADARIDPRATKSPPAVPA